MNLYVIPFTRLTLIAFIFVSCNQRVEEAVGVTDNEQAHKNSDPFAVLEDEVVADLPIPKTLDEALELMMEGLSDADRKFIEDAGEDYAIMMHFGEGMSMRNSWGLWGDSPMRQYFSRLGIFHADDISAIINTAFSRRVRGEDVQIEDLVKYYRDDWKQQDIVAPLDIACPNCNEEMQIVIEGNGASPKHPKRFYFRGNCHKDELFFLYYHKDGWLTREEVESEQTAPSNH